jgi:two-component system nitrogen regulation sensor histidine kinase NtrY
MRGDSITVGPGYAARIVAWAGRNRLGRIFAVALAVVSLISALSTYASLTGSSPLGSDPQTILIHLYVDTVLFLVLGAVVARRLVLLWMERRRGSIGARLHTRLVVLFSLVALTPAVIVSVFFTVFFSFGIEGWFSNAVRTALTESKLVAEAYLKEHQQVIRGDVLAMARDINREAPQVWNKPEQFSRVLARQALFRNLSEAYIVDGGGRIQLRTRKSFILEQEPPPLWAVERARNGDLVVIPSVTDDRIRAVIKLDSLVDAYLWVGRYVEPRVLDHISRTRDAVAQYETIEGQRSSFETAIAAMFALLVLLLLMAAVWVGLTFATNLARPIAALAAAAERVRAGDLAARVAESPVSDEIGSLGRAFNRMTGQLESQHEELMEANRQLDSRRRFMETVLAGVSAGVIGLDADGRVNLPNRSASELLSTDLDARKGAELTGIVPEIAAMLETVRDRPERMAETQINLRREGRARTLLVRLVADVADGRINGFVVTFDDITALLAAQRKAAWADIARRIAHEIKNPLTPIQLSAERLRSKYLKEIRSDPETFAICTDTIVRQVGDIGRMVDEFSSFARMPAPVMKPENLAEICAHSLTLQRDAHPEIDYRTDFPGDGARIVCDAGQIGQALTNLLQNAADSIAGRATPSGEKLPGGIIEVLIAKGDGEVRLVVTDNGRGLPERERDRLTEPYVTTRDKGTGLGLAIVKKIMEDHDGDLMLEDCATGGARVSLSFAIPDGADGPKAMETAGHGA